MTKICILAGSTRDARVNIQVEEWVKSIAANRKEAEYGLIDIKNYNLPRFNEFPLHIASFISPKTDRRKND